MRKNWVIALLLGLAVVLVYARVSTHEFIIYDDPDYVTSNLMVQKGLTWEGIVWAFGKLHGESTYWHPLTWISHMVDCQLFGLNAAAHHWVNVIFHAINAALLFLLLKMMTGAHWPSALGAAIFALHPLQVDTVAWVTERKNVLNGLFWFATIILYLRYTQKRSVLRYSLIMVSYALGLLTKPALVTLPFALLLLDYWPLQRMRMAAGAWKSNASLFVEKLPLLALAAVSSWLTIRAHEGIGMTQDVHGVPLWLRFENAFVSYARYLAKTVWPDNLTILYPHPGKWPPSLVYSSLAILVVLTALVIAMRRKAPYAITGWFWFLGLLVPTIGIVQVGVQAMADRFMYVPIIGLALIGVWAGNDLLKGIGSPRFATILGVMLVMALGGRSFHQLGYWKNSITLFAHNVQVTTNNYVGQQNLAYALAEAGRPQEALPYSMEAIRIYPKQPEAWFLHGRIHHLLTNDQTAVQSYRRAQELRPEWPEPQRFMALTLLASGNSNAAITNLEAYLERRPGDGMTHVQLAELFTRQREFGRALKHYEKALGAQPDWPEALNNLAWMLATAPDATVRNGSEAVRYALRACAVTENKKPIYLGTLAAAYAEAGDFPKAIESATKARELALAQGEAAIAERNAELLQLYSARKPFHQPNQ